MEMESRHLAVMFIGLDAGSISIECCHSTLLQLGSTSVAWYVNQVNLLELLHVSMQ